MANQRTSYLNKYGGISSNTYQLNSQNISTETLSIRGNLLGNLTINGSLTIQSLNLNGNLNCPENVTVNGELYLHNYLVFTTVNPDIYVFPTNTGLGVFQTNTLADISTPALATLDIRGNTSSTLYVFSNNPTCTNTISQCNSRYGVQAYSDSLTAGLYFYSGINIITSTNSTPHSSQIIATTYNLLNYISTNNTVNVYTSNNSNITNINYTIDSTNVSSMMIYDISSAHDTVFNSPYNIPDPTKSPYYYSVYNNTNISMGNAETLFTTDNNSVTYLNIKTPNFNNGMRLGGGVYANSANVNQPQSISTMEIMDICGNYKPIQTIVSGPSPVINSATMGINTYFPITNYTLDVNGPIIIHNTQVENVLNNYSNDNHNIKGNVFTSFSRANTTSGITCYYQSNLSVSNSLNIFYTINSGKQWTPSNIIPITNTTISNTFTNINNSIVYDNLYSIVSVNSTSSLNFYDLCNNNLIYYSTNCGNRFTPANMSTSIQFSVTYFIYNVDYSNNIVTFAGDSIITTGSANYFYFYDLDISSNKIEINTDTTLTAISMSINDPVILDAHFISSYNGNRYLSPKTSSVYNSYNTSVLVLYEDANLSNSTIYMEIFNTITTPIYLFKMNITPIYTDPRPYKMKMKIYNNIVVLYNTYIVTFNISTGIFNNISSGYGSVQTLSPLYYNFWQSSSPIVSTINDVFIQNEQTIIAACSNNQILTTTNGGISWNITSSFPNYGGPLFNNTSISAFTSINLGPDINSIFLSKQTTNSGKVSYSYYYCYNPYLLNSEYNILDICGGKTFYGDISMNGNFTTSGNIKCNSITYNSANNLSDYRIKDNITKITPNMLFVDKLNPVYYINKLTNRSDFGLIAHELQEYYPDLVMGVKDGANTQSVNYTGLISILIKEIQLLKLRVSALESR